MEEQANQKCAHLPYSCRVSADGEYCSAQCAAMEKHPTSTVGVLTADAREGSLIEAIRGSVLRTVFSQPQKAFELLIVQFLKLEASTH